MSLRTVVQMYDISYIDLHKTKLIIAITLRLFLFKDRFRSTKDRTEADSCQCDMLEVHVIRKIRLKNEYKRRSFFKNATFLIISFNFQI